jgi:hypothetical protein
MTTKTGLYVLSASGLKLRDRKAQRLVRSMRVAMPWPEDSDVPACCLRATSAHVALDLAESVSE